MIIVTTKFKINPSLKHSIYIDVVLTISIKKKSITQEHKKVGHPLSWIAIGDSNSTADYTVSTIT